MPGRHNGSSIDGGIFGGAIEQAPPPSRGAVVSNVFGAAPEPAAPNPVLNSINDSSVTGGIFGGPTSQAPPPPRTSTVGGIFAAPESQAPASQNTNMTKSSVEGGIFGGYNHVEQPVVRAPPTPRSSVESMGVAGAPMPKSEGFSLFDAASKPTAPAEPLAPLNSARSNPNASSVEGGIFNSAPPPTKASIERKNPNASSIPGGIFG